MQASSAPPKANANLFSEESDDGTEENEFDDKQDDNQYQKQDYKQAYENLEGEDAPEVLFSQEYLDAVKLKTFEQVDTRTDTQIAFDCFARKWSVGMNQTYDLYEACDKTETKRQVLKLIPPDFFEPNGVISEAKCQQRCTHLGLSTESNPDVLLMARKELKEARTKALDEAVTCLEKFLVWVADVSEVRTQSGGKCSNNKAISKAFGGIRTDAEAIPFWHVYYGALDCIHLWQGKLETFLLFMLDWKYDPDMMLFRTKHKRCCLFRLGSEAINVLRKQVSSYGKRNCGRSLTIKRPSNIIGEGNRFVKRQKNTFMPYFAVKVGENKNVASSHNDTKREWKEPQKKVKQKPFTPCDGTLTEQLAKKKKVIERKVNGDPQLNEGFVVESSHKKQKPLSPWGDSDDGSTEQPAKKKNNLMPSKQRKVNRELQEWDQSLEVESSHDDDAVSYGDSDHDSEGELEPEFETVLQQDLIPSPSPPPAADCYPRRYDVESREQRRLVRQQLSLHFQPPPSVPTHGTGQERSTLRTGKVGKSTTRKPPTATDQPTANQPTTKPPEAPTPAVQPLVVQPPVGQPPAAQPQAAEAPDRPMPPPPVLTREEREELMQELHRKEKELQRLREEQKIRNDQFAEAAKKKEEEEKAQRVKDAKAKAAKALLTTPKASQTTTSATPQGQTTKSKPPEVTASTSKKKKKPDGTNNGKKARKEKQDPEVIPDGLKPSVPVDEYGGRGSNWEIEADPSRETTELTVPEPEHDELHIDEMVTIHNHRKEIGKPAALLVTWKYGCRWWGDINVGKKDNHQLVEDYIAKYNLDPQALGLKPSPQRKIKKQQTFENIVEFQPCQMDHTNWLNYHDLANAGYCKEGGDFYGQKCMQATCNKTFVYNKPSDDAIEFRPTQKRPLHCCNGRNNKYIRCIHALCHDCFQSRQQSVVNVVAL